MSLLIHFLIVIVGALIILITAHYAVKSSIKLAKRFGLSDELLGMTVLAIGTSLPEIMTNIVGASKILTNPPMMNEISGLVIGTTIGSDIFQQNFIIGLVAIIGAVVLTKKHLKKNLGGLIGATTLLLIFSLNGMISRIEGGILFFGYILYLYYLKKKGMVEKTNLTNNKKDHALGNSLILISCFVIMALSANKVVDSSTFLVQHLPISASFFGVIFLGIASALPELTTSLIAVFKRKHKISAGILIGSNITNPMFAIGLGSMISSFTVPKVIILYDLPIKIATALLLFYFFTKSKTLKKRYAVILILAYLAFLFFRNMLFPVDY